MRELGMWVYAHAVAYLHHEPKRDEEGVDAVGWAIITALSVLIAYAVYRILRSLAVDTAGGIQTA